MKRLILATAIMLTPATVMADTQLERFEELAEELNTTMLGMMIREIEGQGGDATALRNIDGMFAPWTDEMRTAAECVLNGYEAETGSASIDAMFTRMEETLPKMAEVTMTEADELGLMDAMSPEDVSLERTLEISGDCGMMELQIEAGRQSGFMEAMMEASSTIP